MGDIDREQLARFLDDRGCEEQADEVREIDSDFVIHTARRTAARWSDHPDYRPEWGA